MADPHSSTGAIILAGGRATRMAGADKASQLLGATPLITHVVAALKPQCIATVINANGLDMSRTPAQVLSMAQAFINETIDASHLPTS